MTPSVLLPASGPRSLVPAAFSWPAGGVGSGGSATVPPLSQIFSTTGGLYCAGGTQSSRWRVPIPRSGIERHHRPERFNAAGSMAGRGLSPLKDV